MAARRCANTAHAATTRMHSVVAPPRTGTLFFDGLAFMTVPPRLLLPYSFALTRGYLEKAECHLNCYADSKRACAPYGWVLGA